MDNQTIAALLGWLERIEVKVDGVRIDISEIKADLAYHIKRTDLLEQQVSTKATREQVEDLEREMKPVVTHVARLQALRWWFGGVVALGAGYKVFQSIGWLP